MTENKYAAARRRANKAYKERNKDSIKRITVDFYPSEAALYEHLQAQPKKQTYIKELIRADMERGGGVAPEGR